MTKALLQVDRISKTYGVGAAAVTPVRDVSLSVAPGESVLIMGPSGSGKSTLLSLLGALLKPTTGTIQLKGVTLSALPESRLPAIRLRQIGFIFQDFNLLSALTVLENVAIVADLAGAKSSVARQKASELLTELGLAARLHFRLEQLSGGEKQRVAIARALVNGPTLILADEPTANLDSRAGHDLMGRLRQLAIDHDRSVVIVSHDQRIKDIADRILWLEDGQIKELAALAIDPVCQMAAEQDRAVAYERDGQTYYFCSRGCRDEFLAERLAATLLATG